MPITDSSKTAVTQLVASSLTNAVTEVFNGEVDFVHGELSHFDSGHIYMLTISGLNFKILCVLQLSDCSLSRQIATQQLKKDGQITDDDFFDFYHEMTNGCFGSTKRLLGNSISHLGMSTPYLLSSDVTVDSITSDEVDYSCHCTCLVQEKKIFSASLLISAKGQFEFSYCRAQNKAQEEAAGALELF